MDERDRDKMQPVNLPPIERAPVYLQRPQPAAGILAGRGPLNVLRSSVRLSAFSRLPRYLPREMSLLQSSRCSLNVKRRIKDWKRSLAPRQSVLTLLLIKGGSHEEGTSRCGRSCGSTLRASGDKSEPSSARCISRATTTDRLYEIWLHARAARLLSHWRKNMGPGAERVRRHGMSRWNSVRAPLNRIVMGVPRPPQLAASFV